MPKILVVDTYADALEAWKLFLESHGFQVISANSGRQALEQAITEQPDIVLLELDRSDGSGSEVAELLHQDTATKNISLVAVTGQSHASALNRARGSGFCAVYVKPYDPEVLVSDLKKLR